MAAKKYPITNAIRQLRHAGLSFEAYLYDYQPRGGTAASSAALQVDEACVIKTLLLEDELKRPLVALMHGDREVSLKQLSRIHEVKSLRPCEPKVAERHSGYQVGGTSPFGLRKPITIYVQESILRLPLIFINGGKRGFLVRLAPHLLVETLGARPASFSA